MKKLLFTLLLAAAGQTMMGQKTIEVNVTNPTKTDRQGQTERYRDTLSVRRPER